jgi:hypothetical protein
VPPYFFHKNIIPKELATHFVQRYHSTEFNEPHITKPSTQLGLSLTRNQGRALDSAGQNSSMLYFTPLVNVPGAEPPLK